MNKIAAYAIMKNEESNILDFIKQFENKVDKLVIVDTGSDDKSEEILHSLQEQYPWVEHYSAIFEPFSFSVARNFALEQARKDMDETDLMLWMDLDERFEDDWYTKLVELIVGNQIDLTKPTVFKTTMVFERRNNQPVMTYLQSKIHTNHSSFSWKYSCHEVLICGELHESIFANVTVDHQPAADKNRNYLPLLEVDYAYNPHDLRCVHYLAREYTYKGDWERAFKVLASLESCTASVNKATMVDAFLLLIDIETQIGRDALPSIYRALSYEPNHPETLLKMCYYFYTKADYLATIHWTQSGIQAISKRSNSHQNVIYDKETDIAWQLYDLAGHSFSQLQNYRQALTYYANLYSQYGKVLPDSDLDRIKNNLVWLTGMVNEAETGRHETNELSTD